MAVALTEFDGMCGFRPLGEIWGFLEEFYEDVSPIFDQEVLGRVRGFMDAGEEEEGKDQQEEKEDERVLVVELFTNLMEAEEEVVSDIIQSLIVTSPSAMDSSHPLFGLLTKLNQEFPSDRGVLCPFFLNILHLTPGQSFFMPPNIPHAYLGCYIF